MKKLFVIFAATALGVFLTAPAWAANVNMAITGAPSSAKQGQTKNFTINVSASGDINTSHVPATVTVNTAYIAGDGSGSPNNSSVFYAPTTPAAGCETFQNKPNECKPTQTVTGGPYPIGASVAVPTNLPPGEYVINVVAAVTQGLSLPSPMPSFSLIVEPAGSAPSVTIDFPVNKGSYKVNEPITASVDVESDLPLIGMYAWLNGNPVWLTLNSETSYYEGDLQLNAPGQNAFSVKAVNAAGEGWAESTFTVHYDWVGWLPPITTAKFQNGRTLPVKFRISDYNGPTDAAIATVSLDGYPQGVASVLYDSYGVPYYQLEVKLNVASGSHTISVALDDGVTGEAMLIQVK